jgi:signal transduction histidine kinase
MFARALWTLTNAPATLHSMRRTPCAQQMFHQYRTVALAVLTFVFLVTAFPARGTVLWRHPGTVLACDNGEGTDELHGAIQPQDTNSDSTLYFRFRVDPISDSASKSIADFQAGFMFVYKGEDHLAIGSTRVAWAYCAWPVPNTEKGFKDLNSAKPDPPFHWEYIRANEPRYIALKVQYVPGHEAHITAWLNPDLSQGATEVNQPTNIVTQFDANATFDGIHLIHRRGNGGGWRFSEMVAGTSFEDLLLRHFWQEWWFLAICVVLMLAAVAGTVQLVERRRARVQIQRIEKERAVATERARIAQDIHDEVGVSLTKISELSELIRTQENGQGSNSEPQQIIAATARDTIRAMDEIVWAINPRNDTLKEMADYLVYFTGDLLTHTRITCKLAVPLNLPDIPVATEVRHSVFMVVKEALNNAVKHTAPKEIRLVLDVAENRISIVVSDDGKGFRLEQAAGVGNGLENMQKRMRAIGGQVEFVTEPGKGTSVKFYIPIDMVKTAP